jgi:hypothetical protein
MKLIHLTVKEGEIVPNDPEKNFLWNHTPGERSICKTEGCKGRVEKQFAGRISSGYSYKMPACNVCGRVYLNALNVPVVGMPEFQKSTK